MSKAARTVVGHQDGGVDDVAHEVVQHLVVGEALVAAESESGSVLMRPSLDQAGEARRGPPRCKQSGPHFVLK